jgi:diguanylate cyclase (GGDEF)-like protein
MIVSRIFSVRTPIITFGGSLILVGAYLIWTRSSAFDVELEKLVSSVILILIYLPVIVFGLVLARRSIANPRQRWCWLFLTLAAITTAIAEILWMVFESFLHVDPFPSIADIFYLLYYPLFLLGVVFLPYAPMRKRDRILFALDLAMILISGAALVWFFVIGPQYAQSIDVSWLERVTALIYPVGDLVLLIGLAILFQRDVQQIERGVVVLLMGGIIFQMVPDLTFAYNELHDVSFIAIYQNVAWMISSALWLGVLAWQLGRGQKSPATVMVRRNPWMRMLRLALPYAAVASSLVLLLVVLNEGVESGSVVRSLIYTTLVLGILVLVRQYLVLVENVQLYHQMQHLALVDSLTGIYNRHSFNENLTDSVRRVREHGRPLSVLLIDVDDFKACNDTYGHLVGDQILQFIARTLSANLRKLDVLARYGGDEFVVLLPETDLTRAQLVADRLEMAVALKKYSGHTLGISVGAAQYHPDLTPEAFLESADRALYTHKANKKIALQRGAEVTCRSEIEA